MLSLPATPVALSRALLSELLAGVPAEALQIGFDDDSTLGGPAPLVMRWSSRATARVLSLGMIGFGDAWVAEEWDMVEGSLLDALFVLARADVHGRAKGRVLAPARVAFEAASRLRAARWRVGHSVRAHYDVDAEFYRLWLDDSMTYTCGYARDPGDGLEQMQRNKLELVVGKLALRPGHTLLDLGCGWGSLAIHAARLGASVTAVNVSERQLAWIRDSGRLGTLPIQLVNADLRAVKGRYDRVAAVGVAEHMGRAHLGDLFRTIAARLTNQGVALVHTIGSTTEGGTDPWIERRIFPGAYVPSLSELVRAAEKHRLRVNHVENLGPHYGLTLRHWLSRLLAQRDVVERRWGRSTLRTWELYLAMLVPAFEVLSTALFQLVLTPGPAPSLTLGLRSRG